MFTGIVQEIGTVTAVTRARDAFRMRIHAPGVSEGLSAGDSVAVDGVCLSAVRVSSGAIDVEIVPETRRVTALGRLSAGARVNLEPSLTLLDRLNGHLVLGHVDGTGRIVRCEREAGETVLSIRIDRALRRYLVPKGSVAVDGVSLTVGQPLTATAFSVFLIHETLQRTTLGARRVGDLVNIEVDYFAKLLAHLTRAS